MNLPDHIELASTESSDLALAMSRLNSDEVALNASFGSEGRRQSFALGRLAARQAVGRVVELPPTSVRLQIAPDGAVECLHGNCYLSISHSGGRAIAAAAREAIGVDIERVKPRPESLFRFMLHPDEQHIPNMLPYSSDVSLALLWSIKESVLKALRTGLRLSPKKLRLGGFDTPNQIHVSDIDDRTWIVRYDAQVDFVLAVASPR